MDRMERFIKMDHILRGSTSVPKQVFLDRLEVSPATFKRDLEYMRDRLQAPIAYDREKQGYCYESGSQFQLPGLWFTADEAHALLTAYRLLENIQPGLLDGHVEPLLDRIRGLLGGEDHSWEEVVQRIRVLPQGARRVDSKHFELVSHAVIARKRLNITHYHRARDERTEREISPQRLVHYRDNWYVDAWCHTRNALRSFAVDSIESVAVLEKSAKPIPDEVLDDEFMGGYGIFGGKPVETAVLRFSPESARWVANEIWHPDQKSELEDGGSYRLEVPYSNPRELLMDILKHGSEVKVLAPESLVVLVRDKLTEAAAMYESGSITS